MAEPAAKAGNQDVIGPPRAPIRYAARCPVASRGGTFYPLLRNSGRGPVKRKLPAAGPSPRSSAGPGLRATPPASDRISHERVHGKDRFHTETDGVRNSLLNMNDRKKKPEPP